MFDSKLLSPVAGLPGHLLLFGNRFAFHFAQIKHFDFSTGGARELVWVAAGDGDVEYLATFVATNRQIHRELKRRIFHWVVSWVFA